MLGAALGHRAAVLGSDRDGLLRAVHSCLIHNTLIHAPEITVEHISILAEIPSPLVA